MAVTHADVAPTPKSSHLGSKTGAFLMVVSILLGLLCFILCLIAEASRSQVKWAHSQCTYTASGKLPLLSATAAFSALAAAMVVHHLFLLVALSKSEPLVDIADSDLPKTFTCQAAFFFVATWASFAVGEIQLLIGVSVEWGHLNKWATPRPSCLSIRAGVFTAAGVLGLATVFLAAGLYITALRAERYLQIKEKMQRQILEASIMYASPPTSPNHPLPPPQTSSFSTQPQHHYLSLHHYLTTFDKHSRSFV